MPQLSAKMSRFAFSETVRLSQLAKQLQHEGVDVIGFAEGEPDFDTPETIKLAAKKAIDAGVTKYTAVRGLPELIEAIREKFRRENQLDFSPEEIIVTTGAKQAIALALSALLDPGDEAIVPAPYWVSYPDMVKLCDGVPVIVSGLPENGYKITAEALAAAVTPRTKLLMLNSPSNPTGALYGKDELTAIAEICRERGLYVLSDEIYEHICFGDEFHSIGALNQALRERVITINGCSKSYAMTGWRIGFAAGDAEIVSAMAKLMSQSTTNACSIAQMAAVAALQGNPGVVQGMVDQYRQRRDVFVAGLQQLGIPCPAPPATFYLFPDVSALFTRKYKGEVVGTAGRLCELLLQEARVALVPGTPFGCPANVRLCFAASLEAIREGLKRIGDFLEKLEG